jgi:hypothetical protein
VIGNGRSLKVEDLGRVRDEITFASNKGNLAFDETSWRPTYYSVSDVLVAQNNAPAINSLDGLKIFAMSLCGHLKGGPNVVRLFERATRPADYELDRAFPDDCLR